MIRSSSYSLGTRKEFGRRLRDASRATWLGFTARRKIVIVR